MNITLVVCSAISNRHPVTVFHEIKCDILSVCSALSNRLLVTVLQCNARFRRSLQKFQPRLILDYEFTHHSGAVAVLKPLRSSTNDASSLPFRHGFFTKDPKLSRGTCWHLLDYLEECGRSGKEAYTDSWHTKSARAVVFNLDNRWVFLRYPCSTGFLTGAPILPRFGQACPTAVDYRTSPL